MQNCLVLLWSLNLIFLWDCGRQTASFALVTRCCVHPILQQRIGCQFNHASCCHHSKGGDFVNTHQDNQKESFRLDRELHRCSLHSEAIIHDVLHNRMHCSGAALWALVFACRWLSFVSLATISLAPESQTHTSLWH